MESSEVRYLFDHNVLSSKHQRIYEWIKDTLELPIYAEIFWGAVVIRHFKLPGNTMFVAHAGREIINGLARTYTGETRKRVQYVNDVEKISLRWNDKWGASSEFSESKEPEHHEIPNDVCKMIKSLMDEHKEGRARSKETNIKFFSEFLNYEDKDKIPKDFLDKWNEARHWFEKRAHVNSRAISPELEAETTKHFDVLVTFLSIAANSQQHNRVREINEILEQANG